MDNNIEFTEAPIQSVSAPVPVSKTVEPSQPPPSMKLTDIPVTDENVALNIIISFLNAAQKRGVFNFEESAKIWECIQLFAKNPAPN